MHYTGGETTFDIWYVYRGEEVKAVTKIHRNTKPPLYVTQHRERAVEAGVYGLYMLLLAMVYHSGSTVVGQLRWFNISGSITVVQPHDLL